MSRPHAAWLVAGPRGGRDRVPVGGYIRWRRAGVAAVVHRRDPAASRPASGDRARAGATPGSGAGGNGTGGAGGSGGGKSGTGGAAIATGGAGGAMPGTGSISLASSWPTAAILTGVRDVVTPPVTQTVQLRNDGTGPVTITAVTLAGTNASAFRLTGITAPASLAAGASMPLAVELLTSGTALPPAPSQNSGGTLLTATINVTSSAGAAQSIGLWAGSHDGDSRGHAGPDLDHPRDQAERRARSKQRQPEYRHGATVAQGRTWHRRARRAALSQGWQRQRDDERRRALLAQGADAIRVVSGGRAGDAQHGGDDDVDARRADIRQGPLGAAAAHWLARLRSRFGVPLARGSTPIS